MSSRAWTLLCLQTVRPVIGHEHETTPTLCLSSVFTVDKTRKFLDRAVRSSNASLRYLGMLFDTRSRR